MSGWVATGLEDKPRKGIRKEGRMHIPDPGAADTQHFTSVRAVVERLTEELMRPDPDLLVAQVLADVALDRLRWMEDAFGPVSVDKQLLTSPRADS